MQKLNFWNFFFGANFHFLHFSNMQKMTFGTFEIVKKAVMAQKCFKKSRENATSKFEIYLGFEDSLSGVLQIKYGL